MNSTPVSQTFDGSGRCYEVYENADAVARRAAELLLAALDRMDGRAAVNLSGGSTPQRLYGLLATPPWRARLPWSRVHWFWGDERFVPHDHPDSNYGMARRTLLDLVRPPPALVHPVPTTVSGPETAARLYAEELRSYYGADALDPARPLFDVSLLGLGEDGHTASLFPGTPALEERRWTAAVIATRPPPRITLTYPALNSSRLVLMLATGEAKRPVLARVAQGADLPALRLRPAGKMLWLLDRAAAP